MWAPGSSWVEALNHAGGLYWNFAAAMFFQVGLLVILLACLDLLVLRHVRNAIRYGVWCLVLVKLMLPVGLQGPLAWTGWLDSREPASSGFHNIAAAAPSFGTPPSVPSDEFAKTRVVPPGRLATNAAANTELRSEPLSVETPAAAVALTPSAWLPAIAALRWQAWLFLAWLTSVSLLLAVSWRRMQEVRTLVRSSAEPPVDLRETMRACEQLVGLRRPIQLRISDRLTTPAICGLRRATILLPRTLLGKLDDEQLRLVFLHELMHWKRLDLQVNCLQTLLQIAYFYNPFVWMANVLLRRLREQAVDDAVLVTRRSSVQTYSTTLLDIVAHARQRPELALRLVGVVESRKALAVRIQRMLSRPIPLRTRLGLSGMLAVLLVGVVLLPLAGRRVTAAAAPPVVEEQPLQALGGEFPVPPESRPAAAAPPTLAATPRLPDVLQVNAELEVADDELAGVVVDEAGQPLEGVTVDAWTWYPGNETKTDAKGVFRLRGLDPKRRVEVLVTKEGYSPQHFAQRPTGAKNWGIILNQRTYLEGKITGPDDQPVAGATLRASFGPVEADGVLIGEVTTEGQSRPDGTYRLYLAPGVYDVQVSAGTQGVYRLTNVSVQAATDLPVKLQTGVHFEALVTDSVTGEPVEGFVLWRWRAPLLAGRSDAKGRIVFDGLIPGQMEFNCGGGQEQKLDNGMRYFGNGPFGRWWSPDAVTEWQKFRMDDRVSGWQRNFDDLGFNLQVGMAPVQIVVEAGVRVSGRVLDPHGNPVAGATVAPALTGTGNSLTGDTRYSVRSNEVGQYEVVLPASNKTAYNLIAHDGDYQEWRNWANGVSEQLKTTPGQTFADFDLHLTQPATIRGRVHSDGNVAGLDVRAHAFDTRENRYYDPTTKTAADGTFELKFVRPGKHYVQVEPFWLRAAEAPAGSQMVQVEAGQVLEGVELIARP